MSSKAAGKAPAFQLYAADFLADENVVVMSNAQVGCYIKLICYCWREGSIPADVAKLSRLCNETEESMRGLWPGISPCFIPSEVDGRLEHARLRAEREKQLARRKGSAASGTLGAIGKWGAPAAENATRAERLANARRLGRHSPDEWQALLGICRHSCVRCGVAQSEEITLCKDHIVPIYRGGSDGIENLQPLCLHCTSSKGPDTTDLRPKGWEVLVSERLANAWRMHGSSSSSSVITTSPPSSEKLSRPKRTTGGDLLVNAELAFPNADVGHVRDWVATRKHKRAGPLTETAIARIKREAAAANLSEAQVIKLMAEMGWTSFGASWSYPGKPEAQVVPIRGRSNGRGGARAAAAATMMSGGGDGDENR